MDTTTTTTITTTITTTTAMPKAARRWFRRHGAALHVFVPTGIGPAQTGRNENGESWTTRVQTGAVWARDGRCLGPAEEVLVVWANTLHGVAGGWEFRVRGGGEARGVRAPRDWRRWAADADRQRSAARPHWAVTAEEERAALDRAVAVA